MNNKCIKNFLILVSSLVAQAAFSNIVHSADTLSGLAIYREVDSADANIADRYTLPPSKSLHRTLPKRGAASASGSD